MMNQHCLGPFLVMDVICDVLSISLTIVKSLVLFGLHALCVAAAAAAAAAAAGVV